MRAFCAAVSLVNGGSGGRDMTASLLAAAPGLYRRFPTSRWRVAYRPIARPDRPSATSAQASRLPHRQWGGTIHAGNHYPEGTHQRVEPMSGHFTRNRLNRCIVGAVSLLVLTCIVIFGSESLKRCPAKPGSDVPSRRYCTIITLEPRTRQGRRNWRE